MEWNIQCEAYVVEFFFNLKRKAIRNTGFYMVIFLKNELLTNNFLLS